MGFFADLLGRLPLVQQAAQGPNAGVPGATPPTFPPAGGVGPPFEPSAPQGGGTGVMDRIGGLFTNPESALLLSIGSSLLASSGYSPRPISTAEAMGTALQTGMGTIRQQQEVERQKREDEINTRLKESQITANEAAASARGQTAISMSGEVLNATRMQFGLPPLPGLDPRATVNVDEGLNVTKVYKPAGTEGDVKARAQIHAAIPSKGISSAMVSQESSGRYFLTDAEGNKEYLDAWDVRPLPKQIESDTAGAFNKNPRDAELQQSFRDATTTAIDASKVFGEMSKLVQQGGRGGTIGALRTFGVNLGATAVQIAKQVSENPEEIEAEFNDLMQGDYEFSGGMWDKLKADGMLDTRLQGASKAAAYMIAKSAVVGDPAGRISDRDVQSAINQLGADAADPEAFLATLQDAHNRLHSGVRTRGQTWFIRASKELKSERDDLLGLMEQAGKEAFPSEQSDTDTTAAGKTPAEGTEAMHPDGRTLIYTRGKWRIKR